MRIVSIEHQKRGRNARITLEDGQTLVLPRDLVQDAGLQQGGILEPAAREELLARQASQTAMSAALRLIAYRPRSEAELRAKLAARGLHSQIIQTIDRLRELSLLDDEDFARSWVDSRNRNSPRGKRLLALELRQKGVQAQAAAGALTAMDEDEAAYRAGARRARLLRTASLEEFRRRVGEFLLRRGFSYETAAATVERLWQERDTTDAIS